MSNIIKQITTAQPGWMAEFSSNEGNFSLEVACWALVYDDEMDVEFCTSQLVDESSMLSMPDEVEQNYEGVSFIQYYLGEKKCI